MGHSTKDGGWPYNLQQKQKKVVRWGLCWEESKSGAHNNRWYSWVCRTKPYDMVLFRIRSLPFFLLGFPNINKSRSKVQPQEDSTTIIN